MGCGQRSHREWSVPGAAGRLRPEGQLPLGQGGYACLLGSHPRPASVRCANENAWLCPTPSIHPCSALVGGCRPSICKAELTTRRALQPVLLALLSLVLTPVLSAHASEVARCLGRSVMVVLSMPPTPEHIQLLLPASFAASVCMLLHVLGL